MGLPAGTSVEARRRDATASTATTAVTAKIAVGSLVARSSLGIRFAVYRSPPTRNGRIQVFTPHSPAQMKRYGFFA